MAARIHVVAGVLRDDAGRVLVAQRPEGKHLAGLWEFPGGKVEAGETRLDALRRELREELGVAIGAARPLIRVPHRYAALHVDLDVFTVQEWTGTPHSGEGQALAWHDRAGLMRLPMPAADLPVLNALRLPHRYAITPPFEMADMDGLLDGATRALVQGVRLLQLRQPHWTDKAFAEAARRLQPLCREHGALLLANTHWQMVEQLDLDGTHLPAAVAATLTTRPLEKSRWLAVSCHDAGELQQASRIGADFATVSPVMATASHPQHSGIGWQAFAALTAPCAFPVFALGGLGIADEDRARDAGAQGIAAIRGLWQS